MTGPVVIAGGMGTGKSSIGVLVAARLGWVLWDNDAELEAASGLDAIAWERAYGIDALHDEEERLFLEASVPKTLSVVLCAASCVERAACRRRMAQVPLVWLRAAPQTVWQRLQRDSDSHRRPNLGSDPLGRIAALNESRAAAMMEVADLTLDTDQTPPAVLCTQICEWLAGPEESALSALRKP